MPLLPFLLKDVYGVPGSIQSDGIHPTAQGCEQVAKNVMDQLISTGKVTRGFLGVKPSSLTPDRRSTYGVQTGGALIEIIVIRRLAKAPRVIVLVATIGVAEMVQAIVRTLPDYRTGKFQTVFPSPMNSSWKISSLGHLNLGGFHLQVTNVVVNGTLPAWNKTG